MNKGKNSRLKSDQGPKIDQMLTPWTGANEANQEQASTSMEQWRESDADPSVIKKILHMNHDLQDRIQQVGADVTTIKNNMDSLKSDDINLGNRIGETESRVSQLEDANANLTEVTTELKNKVAQFEARVQYHENSSRRNNLRIKGVPENAERGKSVTEYVMDMLRSSFPNNKEANQIIIERGRRIPTVIKENRGGSSSGPQNHILVRFLYFSVREKVRDRARDLGAFTWNGSKVEIFPDFSKDVQAKEMKSQRSDVCAGQREPLHAVPSGNCTQR